ncbi:MAG: signal peptidase I [Alphaproteobacteria bacterium]
MTENKENIDGDSQEQEQEEQPVLLEKGEVSEFVKTALLAIALALVIRSVFIEPFNIPSGSMKPTLQVGDYLFVNKPAYGYSRHSFPFGLAPIEGRLWEGEPQRGDVIVFFVPKENRDYIKRVIGLPGDTIKMHRGRLFINDTIVPRELLGPVEMLSDDRQTHRPVTEYIETLPGGIKHSIYEESDHERKDTTELFTVPDGHYFVMGDNRDNSQDSRYTDRVGPVAAENIIGRADFLFFSTNGYAHLFEFWKWPWSIRYERLFMDIDPTRDAVEDSAD